MIFFIKCILLINIIIICSILGVYKSQKFENRVTDLKNIQNSLSMFKSKIEFTYEPIGDIFNEISNVIYKNRENIFYLTAQKMKECNVSDSWYEAIDKCNNNLNKEDRETLKMMGKLLGKTDKIGQINEIKLTSNFLEKQIDNAEFEKLKNTKLYKILGVVSGLGLTIILI